MKTTVEIPNDLLTKAKIVAVERRTTLKNLIIEGLEAVTKPTSSRQTEV